jgi:hypothetical protein
MKTEYLSNAQMERMDKTRLELLPSNEGATIRFMKNGRVTFARVPAEDVNRALFRQRQPEQAQSLAGGNA